MKLFALLALVGFAVALPQLQRSPFKYELGQEYVYSYTGRLLTGIPELSEHHFSGIGIKCQVHLQVKSHNKLILQVRDVEYTRVNNPLQPLTGDQRGHNWRYLQMPTYSPVPSQTMRLLEKPTLFEVSEMTGKVESLTVSSEEPEWSINFKKALIAVFQTGTIDVSEGQMSRSVSDVSDREHGIPHTWTSFEESVDGECETHYELKEIPESMVSVDVEGEKLISRPELCPSGSKTYEMIKTRNLNNCVKTASYSQHTTGHISCPNEKKNGGNCGEMWTRSSVTRYALCGTHSHLQIQSVINEGEINQYPMGSKTEKVLTGSRQVLKLIRTNPIQSHLSEVSSGSVVLNTLLSGKQSSTGRTASPNEPFDHAAADWHGRKVNKEHLMEEVQRVFKEIIDVDLFTQEGLPQKEISFKFLNLAENLKMFDWHMLEKLYQTVVETEQGEKKEIARNMVVDSIFMSGSPVAMKYFVKLVREGRLPRSQVSALLINLPRAVILPTESVLEELFELVKSEHIKSDKALYSNGIISFSRLVEKACISSERKNKYPVSYFGKFCHPESSIVTEKLIPYLRREIESTSSLEKKAVKLVAVSMLSHKQILPIVLPIFEESSRKQESVSHQYMRSLASWALIRVGKEHPRHVLPIVSAIFSNMNEPSNIRLSAFNTMMAIGPDMATLQKVATLTWTEKDMEVLKFVNSYLYTAATSISMQDYSSETSLLIRRARLIYPLIKKTGGSYSSSHVFLSNDYFSNMKVGYEKISAQIQDINSPIPSEMYSKITYFLNEFRFTPVEFGVHFSNVLPHLEEVLSGSAFESKDERKSKLAEEWRQTIEKLRLKIVDASTPEGMIFVRLFEDSAFFRTLSRSGSEELSKVLRNPALLREYLSGEKTFNYQRAINLRNSVESIPSELGLPVYMSVQVPVVFSARGRVNSDVSLTHGKVGLTFKTLVDARMLGRVGTLCPVSGEYIYTAVDQKVTVNLPFDMHVHADIPEGKLSFNVKMNGERPNDIVYVRTLPFTAREKFYTIRPIVQSDGVRIIKSETPVQEKGYPLGEYLGLGLQAYMKTESPLPVINHFYHKLSNLHYNPFNYFSFFCVSIRGIDHSGIPSARRHEYRLRFDPSSSTTKEIDFALKFGYGMKKENEPVKYVKIEEASSSRLPLKVVSKPVGEHSSHTQRQEKIKSILEGQNIESEGHAITVSAVTTLRGSRPRTYVYSATVGTGKSGLKQKWDLKLESNRNSKKICVYGDVEMPFFSIWKLSEIRSEEPVFHYHNTIGYGHECSESKMVINGFAKTSEIQKRLSEKTPEAKTLRSLMEKRVPMVSLSELAEIVRRQASFLDEFHYKVEYITVPTYVAHYHKTIINFLNVYWFPYMRYTELSEQQPLQWSSLPIRSIGSSSGISGSGISFSTIVRNKIHPNRKTFDVEIIESEKDKTVYKDVPMPYHLRYVFPLSTVQGPVSAVVKSVTGKPLYPVCTLERQHITSFDNTTLKAEMDDCYHLLSGDCSKSMQYGVLVRPLQPGSPESQKEVKVYIQDTTVTMKPEGSEVIVKVNGSPVQVPKSSARPVKCVQEGHTIASIIKSKDNVVILKSPKINVYFDGKKIKLEGSLLLKNKLCGLCGDNNNQKIGDVTSPRQCILSKPELLVASHRVSLPSKRCSPLPQHIQSQLKRESEVCIKKTYRPTSVSEIYNTVMSSYRSSERCLNRHHEIVDKYSKNEYCFSMVPVLECGSSCHPVGIRQKTVTFTCMRKNPHSEHIAEKIRRGEVVPSLENMPVSYTSQRSVPVTCKPYSEGPSYGSSGPSFYDY